MDSGLLSRNDNLRLGNTEFHIQTEYYKTSQEVVTLIFRNGKVLKRIERKLTGEEQPNEVVKKQHAEIIHKLLSASSTKEKSEKEEKTTIDELILSADTIDFFRLLVSQIFGRKDFIFAKIIDVEGRPVLEIVRKGKSVDEEVLEAFIEGFTLEEKQFYYLGDDGLYLYGFKLKDGTMVVVGFEREDSKHALEKILYEAKNCLKPECGSRKLSILIVEDVLFTRLVVRETFRLIAKELKDFCFEEIDEAESLYDALSVLKEKRFDIVITDIHLGDGLGTEVAAFIKKHFPETKVIALTMYPEDYEKHRDLFDEYIAKPITPQELKNKLLKIFE
ncbi:response regulator [Desulfurobacterium sp.]